MKERRRKCEELRKELGLDYNQLMGLDQSGTESGDGMRPIEAWKGGIQVAKIEGKCRNARS